MDADFNTGAYASWGPTVANRVPVHASGPYKVPHVRNRTRAVHTNDPTAGAFRGFGVPQAAIAGETLIDDLAEALGLDRWTIRRINALGRGDTTPSGQVLHASAGLPECLDAVRDDFFGRVAEAEALQRPRSTSQARRRHRLHVVRLRQHLPVQPVPDAHRACRAEGELTFFNGAVDIGQGSTTVLLQIAADALGLPRASVPQRRRRHRPDPRRRQDLRLAPDLRVRQRRAARRRGAAPPHPRASPTPGRRRA